MTLYTNLQRIARRKKIPISQIERDLKLSPSTLYSWRTSTPRPNRLKLVADYLGVKPEQLLPAKKENKKPVKSENAENAAVLLSGGTPSGARTSLLATTLEQLTQTTQRTASLQRDTKETQIHLEINLDGTGKADIHTGIGFLDHMLTLLAFHSDFDITLSAHSDYENAGMDPHHLTEDIAITLGKCIAEALGDKRGIKRYGSFTIPMDEALVTCDLDISGRPYLVFNADVTGNPKLGGYDTEMTEEFFRALSFNAGITLHLNEHYGKNTHHIIEGMFKSTARALKQAVSIDEGKANLIPSSKGIL